jgi:tricorn protease
MVAANRKRGHLRYAVLHEVPYMTTSKSGLLLCLLPALFAADTKLLRHPTYHGGKVGFSYLGDIWTANDNGSGVERLTVHKARDIYPRFSPDGKWIAFSSNRYGNYDVFVMPVAGGPARQLTFHTGSDNVVGWTPDSKRILFQAARGRLYPGIYNLYEVPVEGGLERALDTDWGYWGSYSPDGARFAFNRHPMVWWRKHYRGSYAADLWVMDVAARKFQKLNNDDYKGNCFWPMFGAKGEIYFVADRLPNEKNIKPGSAEVLKSVNNIWMIGEPGARPVQITHHTSGNLYFPSISSDGKVVVYEENGGLWKLDTATRKSSQIKLNIVSDEKENNFESLTIQSEADSFHLSPSTRRAAISTHGEIFTVATDRGEVRRVTQSYARDNDPQWSPDGKWLAFVSDRTGREEVWLSNEQAATPRKLSDSDTEKSGLAWAPDSKALLYSASDHKLYRVEIESGKTEVAASSEVMNVANGQFSPDGKWISYTKYDRNMRPHVFIAAASGGQERMLDRDDLFSTSAARWTPDGRRLIFLGGMLQTGTATVRTTNMQLYSVSLDREERNPNQRGFDDELQASESAAGAREARPGRVDVKIEWDGLPRRIRRLTRLGDTVVASAVTPDSRAYAFVTMGEQDGRPFSAVYTIQANGERMTRVATSQPAEPDPDAPPAPPTGRPGISTPQFSRDSRTLYFHERNGIYAADLGGGAPNAAAPAAATPGSPFAGRGTSAERRRLNFTASVDVDHAAEWKQIFEESWRVMKNRFYDAKMHGVDWSAMKERYQNLMEYVGNQEDMHDVVSEMIGELNASHTGISATANERGAPQTRYPGFEIEPDAAGFYKVTHVYRHGPADNEYHNIKPGDFILQVNGTPLKVPENYWKLYRMASGRNFDFTVNSKPAMEGAWKAKIEPVAATAYATLQYEKWVDDRRTMVDKLSGGQIGYLHIRQMDVAALRKFERDLIENHEKKALIIDQRFNPGGGIDESLLEILGQRQYQLTRVRDSIDVTRPQRGFFGPMVVMENERSTSDAEVFPDGFRTLGLGKVVGVTTYGAVIGTGAHRLMDGSTIRTPGVGLWNVKGYNLENYGVPPDVYVDNTPEDFLHGRDAQLEKAVEVLKADLSRR